MHSAFGIDHGGVSKGFRTPKVLPVGSRPSGPQKVKNALNQAGEADVSLKNIGSAAGRGVRGVGGFLEKRPGLTGTALVGGGSAIGYKKLSDREPKRKRTS